MKRTTARKTKTALESLEEKILRVRDERTFYLPPLFHEETPDRELYHLWWDPLRESTHREGVLQDYIVGSFKGSFHKRGRAVMGSKNGLEDTMKLVVWFTVLAVMAGCASVQIQQGKYEVGSFPDVGVRTTVSVGQVMVTKYDYLSLGTATLREGVKGSWWAGRSGVAPGEILVPAISSGERVFCQSPLLEGAQCLKDTKGDGRFDYAYTVNIYGSLVAGREIPPATYRISDQSIKDGFKYELLYQGISNGVIRVAYREYTENLVRAAFSQDLTYTLDPQGESRIRFRQLLMTIHSADNNQIEYTVEAGF